MLRREDSLLEKTVQELKKCLSEKESSSKVRPTSETTEEEYVTEDATGSNFENQNGEEKSYST